MQISLILSKIEYFILFLKYIFNKKNLIGLIKIKNLNIFIFLLSNKKSV